ncbi:uncharacterized protein LOC128253824 [Drosophila gunungcola]|uniref:uncharacterized protein LOC128253824 n=1 Tax=Drosophila gunungcola TaxID=103775 RepID=UPI0022E0EDF4|nr:uncharacterized protein LOC128253824 [Drosophila gunungcola]
MEMDVNRPTGRHGNLMTISARCSNNNEQAVLARHATTLAGSEPTSGGCCGILSRLFCVSRHKATQSVAGTGDPLSQLQLQRKGAATTTAAAAAISGQRRRRTPQEIYFESRGKSCKKLLKFNGNSNKILLYPEEGWARTASSSYWTITPCFWQPNRCRIVECSGTQRRATKARMLPLEQQGSLLIAGHFRRTTSTGGGASSPAGGGAPGSRSVAATPTPATPATANAGAAAIRTGAMGCDKSQPAWNDEFKLYLTSNISMEDYNMGYCLTGFVERRCQVTNTFQMTHFAVIKRQWPPSPSNLGNS